MDTSRLFELIESYDTISIYRHVSPDSDALGSQFGLKQWIIDTYPHKHVYALGNEGCSKSLNFPQSDHIEDNELANSLAIILDTANTARIDDARWMQTAHSIRVDHHIIVQTFADEEIIEDLFGATCEIIAYLLMQEGKSVSKKCAQFLYSGMIADTLRFSIATTTPLTLRVASFLLEAGVDVAKANEENFSTPLRLFKYENYIREHVTLIGGKVAYCIVNREDYERFDLSFNEAKEKVFVLGGVDEFQSWALFVEKEKDDTGERIYNGSLRSRNKTINDIANHYQGGGHRFACGVKQLRRNDIDTLLNELLERMNDGEDKT